MRFQDIYEQYHDKFQFINIYIREAHPVDGWWLGVRLTRNLVKKFDPRVSLDTYDPITIEERCAVAGECVHTLELGIKTYVDEMDDRVNRAYAGWPTRYYLIDLEGKIAAVSGTIPASYRPADLQSALEDYLADNPS